ncbi:helix-turn-helix domain-containing protein [Puia sp.]|jgi:AcrR family transcriptional regulator|uniref:TetR/AcrR family transcriptional regulator n=1 Tax=Puia sp. TaxID=2045100 RepID=UPI002F40A019
MRDSAVKDRILDTASRLFYDQGYHATGINQIIEEADIARASLYNHFTSKTELLLAYLDRTHEDWFLELDRYLAALPTPKEKLFALFDHRIQRQRKLKYKGCHFNKITAETCEDEEVFRRVKMHKERFRQTIRDLVGQTDHRRMMDDETLADTLFLLLEGGISVGAMYRSSEYAEKARTIAAMLL